MAAESIEDLGLRANLSLSPSTGILVPRMSQKLHPVPEVVKSNSLRDPIANDQQNEAHLQQAV